MTPTMIDTYNDYRELTNINLNIEVSVKYRKPLGGIRDSRRFYWSYCKLKKFIICFELLISPSRISNIKALSDYLKTLSYIQ